MHYPKIDHWTICDTLLHMLGCAIYQYLHNYLNKTSRIKQLSLKKRQMLEKLGGVRESRGLSFSSAKPYSLVQRTFHPCHSIMVLKLFTNNLITLIWASWPPALCIIIVFEHLQQSIILVWMKSHIPYCLFLSHS